MNERCKPFESPHVLAGWLCCECRTYNGNERGQCKHCDHWRCDERGSSSAGSRTTHAQRTELERLRGHLGAVKRALPYLTPPGDIYSPLVAELEQLVNRDDPRPYVVQLRELGRDVDKVPSWWSWDCRPECDR